VLSHLTECRRRLPRSREAPTNIQTAHQITKFESGIVEQESGVPDRFNHVRGILLPESDVKANANQIHIPADGLLNEAPRSFQSGAELGRKRPAFNPDQNLGLGMVFPDLDQLLLVV